MNLFRVLPVAIVLMWSGTVFAQEWVEFIDRAELFSVNIPGQPVVTTANYTAANGTPLPAKLYSVQNGASRYSVTVVKFPNANDVDEAGAIAHAAETIRKRGGTLTYDERSSTDGIEGHMLQVTNADKSRTFVSMNLHLDRLYILEATVPAGAIIPGLFQQSLYVLDDRGARVRYQTDANGKKIRVVANTRGEALP